MFGVIENTQKNFVEDFRQQERSRKALKMGAYDSIYARCNCDWPDDERCRALPDDQTRWFNHLLWLESVRQKSSILPHRFDASHWAKRLSVPVCRIEEMVKAMACEGLVGWSSDGRMIILGSHKNHPKLGWKDEEPDTVLNPFKKVVGWVFSGYPEISPDNSTYPVIPPVISANPEKSPAVEKSIAKKRREEHETLLGFDAFWQAYPKKKSKGDAEKAWGKMNPPLAEVLSALEWQRAQPNWTKDSGQFIPYPASYINSKGWEDEPPTLNQGDDGWLPTSEEADRLWPHLFGGTQA